MKKVAKKNRSTISLWYVLIDLFFIFIAVYLPYFLRYSKIPILRLLSLPEKWSMLSIWALGPYTQVFIFWGLLCVLFLNNYHLYRTIRDISYLDETILILKALALATLPAAAAVFFFQIKIYSRGVFLANAVILFISLSGWRMVKRYFVRRMVVRGYNRQQVLIVGGGRIGRAVAGEILANPYLGRVVAGYLDDEKTGEIHGDQVLGRLQDFNSVIRRKFIDEVIITIPSARGEVSGMIRTGEQMGLGIKIVPDFLDLTAGEVGTSSIGNIPLLEYHSQVPHGTDLILKRGFDLLVGGLAFLICLLFLPMIALAIKLNSSGPVFYISDRCGKDGRVFKFYKFRSMVPGAEKQMEKLKDRNEQDGPVFKIRNDPRITRVGRFLRRYSLDELPQLWNVLQGEMSLVGPRPPTPDEVRRYHDWQLTRLSIKPGITCLWQIKGRSDLSFGEWMKWDLFYIENWSFWLDIKILLRTILVVIGSRGAY